MRNNERSYKARHYEVEHVFLTALAILSVISLTVFGLFPAALNWVDQLHPLVQVIISIIPFGYYGVKWFSKKVKEWRNQ